MSCDHIENGSAKPRLHTARSFPRMDTSEAGPFIRSRSKTFQSVATPEHVDSDAHPLPLSPAEEDQVTGPDLFEKAGASELGIDDDGQVEEASVLSRNAEEQSEELPIELISLTDRFVNSLSAKVHSSPPTIEKLSLLYQDFYVRAESHIATHISALASRINRDPSPHTQPKSKSKRAENSRQMLTASEVTEKRIARKMLASKRVALEEAVERRACESIYDKIWRHKSTLDEVRDEKLRSKTATLLLVGINLNDLGVDVDTASIDEEKQKEADEGLSVAREYLKTMNDAKYPLGKLRHLAAAHKAIVDALTKLLPSSSSADEILPTLIYSLITSPPEGINIISNLLFIQRFRSSNKIDGETAYCLTNLEAAISFLENVELSELRADQVPEGPTKVPSNEPTPTIEKGDQPTKDEPASSLTTTTTYAEFSKSAGKVSASNTLPRTQQSATTQQRLNNLFQPPSKVFGAANDAVRNTADQGLKNIGATLDSSFSFLFGRLKELQSSQHAGKDGGNPIVPKTLAEARRLVTSPSSADNNPPSQEFKSTREAPNDRPHLRRIGSKAEDTFLGLVGGQRTPRDRSADSVRTQGSSKKTNAASSSLKDDPSSGMPQSSPASSSSLVPTPLESMRNFGNTLNPLNHIPGMIRSFGRATPDGTGVPSTPSPSTKSPPISREMSSNMITTSSRIDPPIQRFLQTAHASDLTIGDVTTLLEDYKRIAAVLLKHGSNSK
ncbi:VPS9 domain protein [Aspergillus bombycis]|uniref:VPS9 domain protein n=1 Tax=Aspergillus bombycis TaxID=109264 RepID=A0A1F7ZYY5_9EURO|nr:VPS9 domain protein [Aspergillus bombycis]OGM44647.1 VPS9 domain protein [Aspergillus bombycis]